MRFMKRKKRTVVRFRRVRVRNAIDEDTDDMASLMTGCAAPGASDPP